MDRNHRTNTIFGLLLLTVLALSPEIASAQHKQPLISVIGLPIQKVASLLDVRDTGKPTKEGFGCTWSFAFQYKGAGEGSVYIVSKDKVGQHPTSWKVGVFFLQNIGEAKALKLVGLNPKDWHHKTPDSYLSSSKYPHMLVKYNLQAGKFINMETSPANSALKWGLEVARDPHYK
jgi:hypothetical protein